jgi:two-component system, NtrC family, nitrogen regulation sensor histidine kinase NtrY
MNGVRTLFSSTFPLKGRSAVLVTVLSILALLALTPLAEYTLREYYAVRWEKISERKAAAYLQSVAGSFASVQRDTRRTGTDVAQHPEVLAVLADPDRDRSAIFSVVSRLAFERNVGIDVYNVRGQLVCWEGPGDPPHDAEVRTALAGRLVSEVTRTQLYSQLYVALPVWSNGKIKGAVLVRRMLESNYPLSNRLIVSAGLARELTTQLGVDVDFDFSPDAAPKKDGRYLSAPLVGIDSAQVGFVSVTFPPRTGFLENIGTSFRAFSSFLWLLLAGIVCWLVQKRIRPDSPAFMRSAVATLLIWGVRYLLVVLDLPSSLTQAGLFDPRYFAATFGNGLAKSVGELLITLVALCLNLVIVIRYLFGGMNPGFPRWRPDNPLLRVLVAIGSAILVFLFLRGYAASIRSAVFDSTLRYNDPTVIIPPFELSVMIVSLFLLTVALVVVSALSVMYAATIIAGRSRLSSPAVWAIVTGIFGAVALLAGLPAASPIVPLMCRAFFGAWTIGFGYFLWSRRHKGRPALSIHSVLGSLVLAAMTFYPVLDVFVRDRDRDVIESLAQKLVTPSDRWLKFVLDDALNSFASEETFDIIARGDVDELDQLAFDHWARSVAAKEGYSCIFAVTDTDGVELSRFMIGGQVSSDMYHDLLHEGDRAEPIVARVGSGANAVRVYSGSVPITERDGRVIARGYVVLATSRQTLFRGESPEILRNQPQGTPESFRRPAIVSEFHGDQLITSTDPNFPIGYQPSRGVALMLVDTTVTRFWVPETINDMSFDTFYLKRSPHALHTIALSVPEPGFVWHFVGLMKFMAYFFVIASVIGAGVLSVRFMRGRRYAFSFRDRLLGALIVTALIPLILLAAYGRQLANERLLDATSVRLEQQTATLGATIEQRLQGEEGIVQEALNSEEIETLASEAGSDFNLYVGSQLQASSRPELYDVGILDRRLSGLAFCNTVLKGKRFYLQTEAIGTSQYVVGYRPLVTNAGRIAGIVAVPTLYRIDTIEEDLARQNALIFGIYVVVLLAIVIIASVFANRIAAPIHELTLATRQVARGDMNVKLSAQGADGEIGELIRSFDVMTGELVRSRDEIVHIERELAWKEMAKQVAHEIKNPLTPMKLSIQHLRQTFKDRVANFDQVLDEVTRTVIEQIDALSRIAGEFAHFARMPKSVLVPVELNGVVREAVTLFDQDANIGFDIDLDKTETARVKVDREELRRVFINIIRNGIQAMNSMGRLTIRSYCRNDGVVVAIRDEGKGMSPETFAKLFQPNFSTKTDGMGLGLAIAKRSIDGFGGSIDVETEENIGTTVSISLPLSHDA